MDFSNVAKSFIPLALVHTRGISPNAALEMENGKNSHTAIASLSFFFMLHLLPTTINHFRRVDFASGLANVATTRLTTRPNAP